MASFVLCLPDRLVPVRPFLGYLMGVSPTIDLTNSYSPSRYSICLFFLDLCWVLTVWKSIRSTVLGSFNIEKAGIRTNDHNPCVDVDSSILPSMKGKTLTLRLSDLNLACLWNSFGGSQAIFEESALHSFFWIFGVALLVMYWWDH